MLTVLNANKIMKIQGYFKNNQSYILFPNKLKYTFENDLKTIRNLIFNQIILPVAEVENNCIKQLVLYDMRFSTDSTRNIVIMGGNFSKKFVINTLPILNELYQNLIVKKVTLKGEDTDFCAVKDRIEDEGYIREMNVLIGNTSFVQYSLFLNE